MTLRRYGLPNRPCGPMRAIASRVARLPLRYGWWPGFSATMLLVLAAAGAFVYWRVAFAVDRPLTDDLAELARLITPYVDPNGSLAHVAPANTEAYHVLDKTGAVVAHSRFDRKMPDHPCGGPQAADNSGPAGHRSPAADQQQPASPVQCPPTGR